MTAPNYPHVARRQILHQDVIAFNAGDLIPDGTPATLGLVEGTDYDPNPAYVVTTPQTSEPGEHDGDDTPAKSASKADWVAHAVARGMTETDADARTKEQLVELYG